MCDAKQIVDEVGCSPTRMMSRQFSNQSTSFGMEEQKSKYKSSLHPGMAHQRKS